MHLTLEGLIQHATGNLSAIFMIKTSLKGVVQSMRKKHHCVVQGPCMYVNLERDATGCLVF